MISKYRNFRFDMQHCLDAKCEQAKPNKYTTVSGAMLRSWCSSHSLFTTTIFLFNQNWGLPTGRLPLKSFLRATVSTASCTIEVHNASSLAAQGVTLTPLHNSSQLQKGWGTEGKFAPFAIIGLSHCPARQCCCCACQLSAENTHRP